MMRLHAGERASGGGIGCGGGELKGEGEDDEK